MICSLKFKERSYLKNFVIKMLLWIYICCAFGFEALCTIQVVISIPLWIKLTTDQSLLFSLCNFSSFFSYVGGIPVLTTIFSLFIDWYHDRELYFGYSANYNTQRAFAILFLICSDLLNFLRSLGTMVITTERD